MTLLHGMRNRLALFLAPGVFVMLLSCQAVLPETKQIQIAYVGPASASLREDLATRSSAVTSLKHGERLEILDTRRRLVRARTQAGAEGWIDANLLLTAEQMEEYKRITELAAKLPSQGKAVVSDALNGHPDTNRKSPGSFQIPEGGKVEVLAHRTSPRQGRPSLVFAAIRKRAVPQPKAKAKNKNAKEALLLPSPPAPAPPPNWLELSRPRTADLMNAGPANSAGTAAHPALTPTAPPEDWSLVRTGDGQVGWVLTRMLYMEIPDEVVRYTGGFRVTAYLDLGEVEDEDRHKHNWVWTTASANGQSNDFDSFRVLVWNPGKHRYETAHLEKDMDGHYPLSLVAAAALPRGVAESLANPEKRARPRRARKGTAAQDAPLASNSVSAQSPQAQFFSLVMNDPADGRPYVRVYALVGRRVKLLSRAPAVPSAELPTPGERPVYDPLAPSSTSGGDISEKGWWQKSRAWLSSKVTGSRQTDP